MIGEGGAISRSGPHQMRVKGHSCVDSHRKDISGSISLSEALSCKSWSDMVRYDKDAAECT